MSEVYNEAHSAVAVGIAECFTQQPCDLPWEQRCDELATAAIEAMQIFISMRPIVKRYLDAQAIEAGTAKTEGLGPQDESAVR